MFGIDEIFEKLLNEARSIEDIQKLLINRYVRNGDVPQEVFMNIFNADPTKKKAYARWMLDKYGNESKLVDMIVSNGIASSMFKYFQERAHGESPINLVDIPTVERAYSLLPEEIKGTEDNLLRKDGDGPENDFDVVYDTPEWKIVRPNTYEAAEKLGEGCKWCTSGAFRNGRGYFNDYTSSGPLWINLDYRNGGEIGWGNGKEYPFKRYQFCFERNAYMDHHDDPVDFEKLDMPEEVIDFYGDEDSSYKDAIEEGGMSEEERFEAYAQWRNDNGIMICQIDDNYLEILPEFDNNYETNENASYYLYDTSEDDYDPICYSEFNRDADWMAFDGSETYKAVILKDNTGDFVGVYYGLEFDDSRYRQYRRSRPSFHAIEDVTYLISHDEQSMLMYRSGKNQLYVYSNLTNKSWSSIETYGAIENVQFCSIKTPSIDNNPCVYIQVEYTSGTFGLYMNTNDSEKSLSCIIKSDQPKNGEEFNISKIRNQGEWYVIEGKFHTYSLYGEQLDNTGSTDTSDLSDYHVQRQLTDIIYVIEKKDESGLFENLYDVETKQKLLPTDSRKILTLDELPIVVYASDPTFVDDSIKYVSSNTNGCPVRFFNYENRRISMTFNRESFYKNYLLGTDDKNTLFILDHDMNVIKSLPGYVKIGRFGGENALYFKNDSGVHCCLIDDNLSIQIPNGIDSYTSIGDTIYAVVEYNGSDGENLVDIRTWKTLVKNIVSWKIIKSFTKPEWQNCIKYSIGNDEWNILYDGKILLPFNVENVDEYVSVPGRYIPFNKNDANYIYDLTNNTILPNKNGFRKIDSFGHFKNGSECFEVRIDIPTEIAKTYYGSINANFDPNTNTIIYLDMPTRNITDDEKQKIIEYVNMLYGYKPVNQENQLTESFRSMMDRLDKVVF